MKDFFASLYEFFGLFLLFSRDMGDYLRGWDITCTDYVATPWYVYIGSIMIGLTVFLYALQYHIIDSSKLNKRIHWWLFALIIAVLNFVIAFSIPYNALQASDYCKQLNLSTSDCLGFATSNAFWAFVLFVIISSIPWIRRFSTNCRHTTLLTP